MNSAHPYSSSSDLLQWLLFFGLIWCVWSLRGLVIVLGFSAAAALHLSVLGLQHCDRICRELLQLQLYVVSRCMPCLARLMLICIEDCAAGVRWLLWCSSVFVYVYSFVRWWASLMVCLLSACVSVCGCVFARGCACVWMTSHSTGGFCHAMCSCSMSRSQLRQFMNSWSSWLLRPLIRIETLASVLCYILSSADFRSVGRRPSSPKNWECVTDQEMYITGTL